MITYKRGDTFPPLAVVLLDGTVATDLTAAASVRFLMADATSGTVIVDAAATITDAPTGAVSYLWSPGDLDIVGTYEAEFEVTWVGGGIQTFPSRRHLRIAVVSDLG